MGLRKLFGVLGAEEYSMAVRALGILNWDRTCRFCSACGAPLRRHDAILAKQCEACGFTMFPRISPAVIVLVERQDKVLLARASRFAEDLYSVLAGFAEPGETLEDTVRREIREEVGIEVGDIRYFGSQPWPYPDSLMIAFTASWAAGEINVDNDEISDARWFTVDDLPKIPDRISIARSLIDWFIEKHGKGR
jgi:NAD+ diphosphatase